MMNRQQVIDQDNTYLMHTYGRLPVVPESGHGAILRDADGTEYVDFTSGIGVNALGFCHEGWVSAVTAQLGRFQHVSNYYYCDHASAVAQTLTEASGLRRMFFCNSGAEANEGAIKLARKYSHDRYGDARSTVITLKQSFHGRTVTTLAATGQDALHTHFSPFTEGFRYVEANNIEALKAAATEDVCAIMMELIQGEGGVNILSQAFVDAAAALCRERDILLILDEVQTGIGRTGKLYAYQHYGIMPDIVTTAKGLGNGLPIGAFLAGARVADTLSPGQHGTTFGANPVCTAGAEYVLSRILSDGFLDSVTEKGAYIQDTVRAWNLPIVREVRGLGLMIGICVDGDPAKLLARAQAHGLLVLRAGKDVVRLLPPLNISYAELDRGLALLRDTLSEAN